MPTVYIETSIVSFLRKNPGAAADSVLREQITRAWWDFHRHRYELVAAQYVFDECHAGNAALAAERLEVLSQIPLLSLGDDIDRLSRPQYRLRVDDDIRVFYDVAADTVSVLAIVSTSNANPWLERSPQAPYRVLQRVDKEREA